MAFRLSKTQGKQRDALVAGLQERTEKLTEAIGAANVEIERIAATVNEEVSAYNQALADAREFIEAFVQEKRDDFDGRSERWQGSEVGETVSGWLDEWEGIDLAELEEITIDPIDEPETDHATELGQLSEEP